MSLNRIEAAERHLDRMNSFHPRIDAKMTAVAAWLSVELAVIGLNTKLADLSHTFVWLPLATYIACSAVAGFFLWKCVFPETHGGKASLTYFAEIAKRDQADFVREYKVVPEDQLLDDLAGQIWRNAEIVCDKYYAVQWAVRFAVLSLFFLVITVIGTSIVHQALPSVSSA
jgi:hypothetical protein